MGADHYLLFRNVESGSTEPAAGMLTASLRDPFRKLKRIDSVGHRSMTGLKAEMEAKKLG